MKSYLIAFGPKPRVNFLEELIQIAKEENVEIVGATLTTGFGCYNLAIMVDDDKQTNLRTFSLSRSCLRRMK